MEMVLGRCMPCSCNHNDCCSLAVPFLSHPTSPLLLLLLQGAVLTDDNVRALRGSVLTLCRTLEHVESISADVSVWGLV